MGIAEDLLLEVDKELVLRGEQSREKFLTFLKDQSNVFYPISEFSSVLGLWQKDYMMGMRELVTDLYDPREEYTRQTMKGDKIVIKRPAITILASSTADWLRERLTEGDLRGGLMGRFLFFGDQRKEEDKGLITMDLKAEKEKLAQFLKGITDIQRGWLDITRVRDQFNIWLKSIEQHLQTKMTPDTVSFQSRIGSHTLKLLTLITVSEMGPRQKFEATSNELNKAIMLSGWLLEQAEQLAATSFIKNKMELQIQKFLQLTRRTEGIERGEALKLLHLSAKFFSGMVNTVIERREVDIIREKRRARVATIYKFRKE